MKLVYIHGHGASKDSFNFLRLVVGGDAICLEYDSDNGFAKNEVLMIDALKGDFDVFFVAHSQGGNYALRLADILGERCLGAVTMGTPYGGSESALWLNLSFPQQLYRDIHPGATPITRGRKISLHSGVKWTAIVSTKGHSQMMLAANDGVVTSDSMRDRRGVTFVEVATTHHEVVQNLEVAEIIKTAIAEVEALQVAA